MWRNWNHLHTMLISHFENSWHFLKRLIYEPEMPVLDTYWREMKWNLYMNVHSSVIHSNLKWKYLSSTNEWKEGLYMVWFHLYEISIISKSLGTESRLVVAYGQRPERNGDNCSWTGRFLLGVLKFSHQNGFWWWLYNYVNILRTADLYTLNSWNVWQVSHILKKEKKSPTH